MNSMVFCVSFLLFTSTTFQISSSHTVQAINGYYANEERKPKPKRYSKLNPKIHPLPPKWQYETNKPTSQPTSPSTIHKNSKLYDIIIPHVAINNIISPTPEPTPRPSKSPIVAKMDKKIPYHSLKINTKHLSTTHLTRMPTPNPTPQGTNRPHIDDTYFTYDAPPYTTLKPNQKQSSEIDDICRYTMSRGVGTDFIILYDNSCKFSTDNCNNLLDGINKIISKMLILDDSWLETNRNRVQTMQIRNTGHSKIDVAFDNHELQNNPHKYVNYMKQYGKCTEGGTGTTDVVKAFNDVISAFNTKDNRKDKLIIVSGCMDDRREKVCNQIRKHLYDLGIEIFVINLIDGSDSTNVITEPDANMYLKCAANYDANRVCTNKDISFDNIIENCLLPQICIPKNGLSNDWNIDFYAPLYNNYDSVDYPTPEPTPRPTVSPALSPTYSPITAYPTVDPTVFPSTFPTSDPTPKPTQKPTDKPTHKPTTKPTTSWPTLWPTPEPTYIKEFGCDARYSHGESIDFIIFIDNSCGLSNYDSDNVLQGIGEIIYKLLDYPNTRIATMHFGAGRGEIDILVDYNDITLQRDANEYVRYIKKYGDCTKGGQGQTNLYIALKRALKMVDEDKITKFIIISACKDTTSKVCRMERCGIDMYAINLILATTDIYNMIETEEDAYYYLYCLTNKKQRRVCLSDDIDLGVVVSEFDDMIDNCLMPYVCMADEDEIS